MADRGMAMMPICNAAKRFDQKRFNHDNPEKNLRPTSGGSAE